MSNVNSVIIAPNGRCGHLWMITCWWVEGFLEDVQFYLFSDEAFMRIKRFDLCFHFWHMTVKNGKLEIKGSTSNSPFRESESWWGAQSKRYHCPDVSYQKWFQSDWSLEDDFATNSKKWEPTWGPLPRSNRHVQQKLSIKHVPEAPISVSSHQAW